MINYRFLNYKHSKSFERDLLHHEIPDGAIVFVLDECFIWARGKKYMGAGSGTADVSGGVLRFKDGSDNTTFTITQRDGDLILTDSKGNLSIASYALKTDVDNKLKLYATNAELDNKADKITLGNYVTIADFNQEIDNKQDKLTAGNGVEIVDNTINVTLDTNVFVIVEELPTVGNPNKSYLLEIVDGGNITYTEYRYKDGEWVLIGQKIPEVDLSNYLKTSTAKQILEDYSTIEYVDKQIRYVLEVVDKKYVLKKDVYTPELDDWSTTDIDNGEGTSTQPSTSLYTLITLSQSKYDYLAANNQLNKTAYYFTYEDEDETNNENWTFGDQFPVILTGQWVFGGTFPITLS